MLHRVGNVEKTLEEVRRSMALQNTMLDRIVEQNNSLAQIVEHLTQARSHEEDEARRRRERRRAKVLARRRIELYVASHTRADLRKDLDALRIRGLGHKTKAVMVQELVKHFTQLDRAGLLGNPEFAADASDDE